MSEKNAPVLIELENEELQVEALSPEGEDIAIPTRPAPQRPARRVRLGLWLLSTAVALVVGVASVALWGFVSNLLVANPVLGTGFAVLFAVFVLLFLIFVLREGVGFLRLRRLDHLQRDVRAAHSAGDDPAMGQVLARVAALYARRAPMQWHLERFQAQKDDVMEADTRLQQFEDTVMASLDEQAVAEVLAASRRVATVTALVPVALVDLMVAAWANIRMVRAIAEIYGGRTGAFGSWRLMRAVITHLAATGMVAIGDDMIGSIAGGGALSKISRRFGEGLVNGALTARVGVAAMECCRPVPFLHRPRPRVSRLVKQALTGLFSSG